MKLDHFTLDIPNTFKNAEKDFEIPNKLLLSGGPTNFSPRVISALTNNTTTSLCKEIYKLMDDIKEMLKYVFQTKNEVTLAIQNSGTGGLEAALTNLVEPGEKIIIASGGVWGDRTVRNAQQLGIDVVKLETKLGEVFTFEKLEKEIIKHKPVLLFITQGESSGGTNQPLEGLGDICHKYNCLLAVDAVVSLGGVPYHQDRWGIDVGVAASQKAIGAPAGIAFMTFSPRAMERMRLKKTSPPFIYNILELGKTWNCFKTPRKYVYTFNSHMLCATREALAEVIQEGLENRWKRHKQIAERFWKGMEKLGMKHIVPNPEHRLWTVNLVYIPTGVKWPMLIDYLEEKHKVTIGFGVGPTANIGLRIGIMGYNARDEVVDYFLEVLQSGINYCRSETNQSQHSFVITDVD